MGKDDRRPVRLSGIRSAAAAAIRSRPYSKANEQLWLYFERSSTSAVFRVRNLVEHWVP